jgi:uncharacterized protein (TIGR00661 family)
MYKKKINNTVLIAPLDWGLGHATRCIPIIQLLIQKNFRVLIATNGPHLNLLKEAFPQLGFLHLNGYGINYAKKNMLFHLAKQLPNFLRTIKMEHDWLDKTLATHEIDVVISDNRYGLWSKKVPCIFITHQLQLQLPFFMHWANKIIQKKMYGFINKFTACWVPDVADEKLNLSGKLGHPAKMPNIPVNYIGSLSRFKKNNLQEKKYALMVCLSGPEPQRSLFESIVLDQLKNVIGEVVLVRGKPGSAEVLPCENNITIFNHLPTMQMQQAFEQSEFVLSRCGYTTLMDMQTLACKCIYVPTPGQTEQEYLGGRLQGLGIAIVFKQDGFNLEQAMNTARTFDYKTFSLRLDNLLEHEITRLLKMIEKA